MLSATLYHITIDCQSVIMARARWKQGTVKHYLRTDVNWEEELFLRKLVAALLFLTIGILLARTTCSTTPAIRF